MASGAELSAFSPPTRDSPTGAAAGTIDLMSLPDGIPEVGSHPGLQLLMLVGSRTTGKVHELSDWDFAYLAEDEFDPTELHTRLIVGLNTERVDLANLRTASALFRYRAALDGKVLYDANREWEKFQLDAASFWLEVEPTLRASYRKVRERLVTSARAG